MATSSRLTIMEKSIAATRTIAKAKIVALACAKILSAVTPAHAQVAIMWD
jgi:hypothetical protein